MVCIIPKLFYLDDKTRGMKLTKPKLVETLRVLNDGASKYQARKIAGITKQRVYQVWNDYNKTGEIPVIGKKVGRPKRPITEEERTLVKEAWIRYERVVSRNYFPSMH